MRKITIEELNELLKEAEKAAESSSSLSAVFSDFANRTGRAKGGVRNIYYAVLKESRENDGLKETFPSLKKLKAEKNRAFSKQEENDLFERISAGIKGGKSVRKVIKELANGDEKTALRYQNKYRNILKKQKDARKKDEKDSLDYFALRRAIDDLFDRIAKQRSRKEEELKKENEALKEQVKLLRSCAEESKAKKFFLSGKKKNGGEKIEKVPE